MTDHSESFTGELPVIAQHQKAPEELLLTIEIKHKIRPVDRGDLYEDPLDEMLKANGSGYLDGGGSYLVPGTNEIDYVDIRVIVAEQSEALLDRLVAFFEGRGAPKGSVILDNKGNRRRSFGVREGLGLYLNGTDLPSEVYASNDVNKVIAELNVLLGDEGQFTDFWEGSKETGLFAYGTSFERMNGRIVEFVKKHPLCAQSRLVQIA